MVTYAAIKQFPYGKYYALILQKDEKELRVFDPQERHGYDRDVVELQLRGQFPDIEFITKEQLMDKLRRRNLLSNLMNFRASQ